jgi:adenylylsulfate reductase subunit A
VRNYLEHKDCTTAIDVNPNYITPKMLLLRLQKIMDEYVAGVSTLYQTNAKMMGVAELKLEMLKEDAAKMRAKDLHELLRAWENHHRILTAEAHMKHIQFREESRYPGFYYRMDYNFVDDENWKCFVNSVYDKETKTWTCFKRAHVDLVDKSKLFKRSMASRLASKRRQRSSSTSPRRRPVSVRRRSALSSRSSSRYSARLVNMR